MRAYIGAATTSGKGSSADGITIADVEGGELIPVGGGARDVENPMYLTLSADGRVVYTVHAAAEGQVSAWSIDGTQLHPLGEPRSTGGSNSCHLSIHPSERYLLTADYGSGSVSVHPILDDGSLGERSDIVRHTGSGPNAQRQETPHAHMVMTDPGTGSGRGHVLVTDLGTDTLYRYVLDDASGQLRGIDEVAIPDGAGPRHLVVHGDYAYVVNELDSTISVVHLAAAPAPVVATVATRAAHAQHVSQPSAIRLDSTGRFLYVANRGPDEIAVLSVDGADLALVATVPCGGTHPRDMTVDPTGRYLFVANQFSDEITSFRLDPATGVPEPDGTSLRTPSPACVVFS